MTQENLPVEVSKDDNEIYVLLDRLDEERFLDTLKGRDAGELAYRFRQDGKEICNLSKAGVDACATMMAAQGHCIEEEEVKFLQDPSDPEYFLFTVIARRILIDKDGNRKSFESVNGAKRQWKKMKRKDGNIVPDPFWFEKGCMKAGRNARIRLILPEIKAAIISAAKSDGKIRDVTKEDLESTPQAGKPKSVQYADRAKVEEWIAEYIGPSQENKKYFKLWAASFNMIDKNQFGHATLDKVHSVFAERLFANPDNAVANFASWFEIEQAKQTVKEVFPEAEVVGGDHETATS